MSFMKGLIGSVANFVVSSLTGNPYQVVEVNASIYNVPSCKIITQGQKEFNLYKNCTNKHASYDAVLIKPHTDKVFCVSRFENQDDAIALFSLYHDRLITVCNSSRHMYQKTLLQKVCDCLRENTSWSPAHVVSYLGHYQSLKNKMIASSINYQDATSKKYPIHLAIEAGSVDCVREILIHSPGIPLDLDAEDCNGDNVFHYVSRQNSIPMFKLLITKVNGLNKANCDKETPLHVALTQRCSVELIELFLTHGADPRLSSSLMYPIHCAMKIPDNMEATSVLCKRFPGQVDLKDAKHGGAPIHWARVKEAVHLIAEMGADLNAQSNTGDTALHIMIKKGRTDCIITMLTWQVDVNVSNSSGNTALHLAVMDGSVSIVKALIAFGADINTLDKQGCSARHMAATGKSKNKRELVYALHMVGAKRCTRNIPGCNDGCSYDGIDDGSQKVLIKFTEIDTLYDSLLNSLVHSKANRPTGLKLLCLDGGGIRGLVLIQLLFAIETATGGKPLRDLFNWISGTSTGGILALALTHGKSVRYLQGLYFRLKDTVFQGKRPYSSEALESFLVKEFGEYLTMMDLKYPNVMVTGVLGDRHPAELHMFRNYNPPDISLTQNSTLPSELKFKSPPQGNEQLVWKAARATGAAPTYFRANGRFLDGGLIANNPTMDAMTEIHEYNMSQQAHGGEVRPLGLVVSLGTGQIPVTEVKSIDVFMPEGIRDLYQVAAGIPALVNLLVDQVTQADGRVNQRAKAWCSMIQVPYYRLSPQLTEDVKLDCNDDAVLLNMMWETQCYVHRNQDKIRQIAHLLTN